MKKEMTKRDIINTMWDIEAWLNDGNGGSYWQKAAKIKWPILIDTETGEVTIEMRDSHEKDA